MESWFQNKTKHFSIVKPSISLHSNIFKYHTAFVCLELPTYKCINMLLHLRSPVLGKLKTMFLSLTRGRPTGKNTVAGNSGKIKKTIPLLCNASAFCACSLSALSLSPLGYYKIRTLNKTFH